MLKMQKGYTLTELIIVVFILGIFGVIGTMGYVAIHFISKFW